MLDEEEQRECVSNSDGLWAWWRITGHSCCHRDCCSSWRWITHQRSSVNHQSPLTPRRRQCPPHHHHQTAAHLCRLTGLHAKRMLRNVSHWLGCADESAPAGRERFPLTSYPSNRLPFASHSFEALTPQPQARFFLWSFCPTTSIVHHHPRSLRHRGVSVSPVSPCPPSHSEQIIVDILKGPADGMARCGGAISSATSADAICLRSGQLGGQVGSWWQAHVTSISLIRPPTLLTALTIRPYGSSVSRAC